MQNDISFNIFARKSHIEKYFSTLAENALRDINSLFDWFGDIYIGCPHRRENGRRASLYPLSMSNLY